MHVPVQGRPDAPNLREVQDAAPSSLGEWRGRHVVIVNWRDSRHPHTGGAESYCEEVARELAARSVRVTLLTARFDGSSPTEARDGFQVVRRGGKYGVYPSALRWLLTQRAGVDAIIDSQNGVPFFTPLVTRRTTPVVLLLHHVHQAQFGAHFSWPLRSVGRWLEGPGTRLVYGGRPVVAVSPSSRAAARTELRLRGPIHVAPCGIHRPARPRTLEDRAPRPTVVVVGRLVLHKRVDVILDAVGRVGRTIPDVALHLIGDGPERPRLERYAARLSMLDKVTFHGYLTDDSRDALLRAAWVTVSASAGEGWGLSVMEAAAHGVPAVAIRVPGLKDAVLHGRTGWLVDAPEDLGDAIRQALVTLQDVEEAGTWTNRCRKWAACFSWEDTAVRLMDVASAEESRLMRRREGERRRGTDLATIARMPPHVARTVTRAATRRTDIWRVNGDCVEVLMPAADESDVRSVMRRLGISDLAHTEVKLARSTDLLVVKSASPSR